MLTTSAAALTARINQGMTRALVESEDILFGLCVALLAGGHVLIEGVPGTGKTLAVRAFAALLNAQYRRIQCTPDMLPADIIGTSIFDPRTLEFTIRPGPILANVLLADEINRTPPKTQSALLEAMQEHRVTIDGTPVDLPTPFLLCATQNPIEYEGTYPLPEAQLDRFLVKIASGYPSRAGELELLDRVADGFDAGALEPPSDAEMAQPEEIAAAQRQARSVRIADPVKNYILDVLAGTRADGRVALGASPRAGVALLRAAQAAAAMQGREFTTPDDVKRVAPLVLVHRILVQPQAEIDGTSARIIVDDLLESVPVPRELT